MCHTYYYRSLLKVCICCLDTKSSQFHIAALFSLFKPDGSSWERLGAFTAGRFSCSFSRCRCSSIGVSVDRPGCLLYGVACKTPERLKGFSQMNALYVVCGGLHVVCDSAADLAFTLTTCESGLTFTGCSAPASLSHGNLRQRQKRSCGKFTLQFVEFRR